MRNTRLEPGILPIFRLFLIAQLVLIITNISIHYSQGTLQGCPWFAVGFSVSCILFMLTYLSWSWFSRWMGRFYLTFAIAFIAVFSLVVQNLFLKFPLVLSAGNSEESAWLTFLFLFVPLIFVSWQYGFKSVVIFCVFSSLLDFLLVRYTNPDYFSIQEIYLRLMFVRFLSFMLVGYIISRIMQQLRKERQSLQIANRKLESNISALEQLTVSRERNRVARELHDTLSHTLSGLAVQLEAVDSLWESDRQQAHKLVQQSLQATRHGLTETRNAIQSLRASPLETMGLARALKEFAQITAVRSGFQTEFDLPPDIQGLPPVIEQCFYRIGQEAIENASRHSQANTLKVQLTGNASKLSLLVEDNGSGFDLENADKGRHFGLQGIRERAELINAHLEITSSSEKGTRLVLSWREETLPNGQDR